MMQRQLELPAVPLSLPYQDPVDALAPKVEGLELALMLGARSQGPSEIAATACCIWRSTVVSLAAGAFDHDVVGVAPRDEPEYHALPKAVLTVVLALGTSPPKRVSVQLRRESGIDRER